MSPPAGYDDFARDYHWMLADEELNREPFFGRFDGLLADLPAGAAILDCACGIGLDLVGLAQRGYAVVGSDGSQGMVAEARKRLDDAGLDVPLVVSDWADLPARVGGRFDAVFCCGNCIGHCRDAEEMIAALRGMRGVLADGGLAVVDSRDLDRWLIEAPRFRVCGVHSRDRVRCYPLVVISPASEEGGPSTIELVLVFDDGESVYHRAHAMTYYPFTSKDLLGRARAAGFGHAEIRPDRGGVSFTLIARR